MIEEPDYFGFVNGWLEQSTKDLSSAHRLELFEVSLDALWNCPRSTLGEVTLSAIMDRVLLIG